MRKFCRYRLKGFPLIILKPISVGKKSFAFLKIAFLYGSSKPLIFYYSVVCFLARFWLLSVALIEFVLRGWRLLGFFLRSISGCVKKGLGELLKIRLWRQ